MFQNISIEQLKKINNPILIDIRSIEKYNNNHIMNSINIPAEYLLIKPEKYLTKEKKYYLYCQKGIQSRKICQILTKSGYNVTNISGGYESWILNE